jgi:hypothetical protein
VVFSHGWPLNSDAWEDQMVFLGLHGYRSIGARSRSFPTGHAAIGRKPGYAKAAAHDVFVQVNYPPSA